MNDFKFSVEIDPYQLDKEWVDQPRRYHHVALALADARRELDEAKNALELVKAELSADIASTPETYGLVKTTVDAVASCVIQQPSYKEALKVFQESKYAVGVLEAGVTAFDQRKKALENLVSLQLADYYSRPSVKAEHKEAMTEAEKAVVRGRRAMMKKRSQEN